MLSRICQLLRRKIHGFNVPFDFNLCDTRGLRNYPKSTPRSQRNYKNKNKECPYKVERLTEGDCI